MPLNGAFFFHENNWCSADRMFILFWQKTKKTPTSLWCLCSDKCPLIAVIANACCTIETLFFWHQCVLLCGFFWKLNLYLLMGLNYVLVTKVHLNITIQLKVKSAKCLHFSIKSAVYAALVGILVLGFSTRSYPHLIFALIIRGQSICGCCHNFRQTATSCFYRRDRFRVWILTSSLS